MKFCSNTLPVQGTEDFRWKCGGHSQRAKPFAKIKSREGIEKQKEKPYFFINNKLINESINLS